MDGRLGSDGQRKERTGDIATVDERPPGRAVGLDANLAVGHRRAQEVVDHQVDPEHRRVAIGRGVAEEDRREPVIRQLGDGLLGLDLGLGIGGERVERICLVEVELLALAVDRAAPGEEVARDAGFLGNPGQADGSISIDVEGDLSVQRPHRIVGDRRQVHHAVAAVEVAGLDLANVLRELPVGLDHGLPVTSLEETEVATDDGVAFLLQQVDHDDSRCSPDGR